MPAFSCFCLTVNPDEFKLDCLLSENIFPPNFDGDCNYIENITLTGDLADGYRLVIRYHRGNWTMFCPVTVLLDTE